MSLVRTRGAFALALVAAVALAGCRRRTEAWPAEMKVEAPSAIATDVHAARGDVVLLVLYASWCHSCREELPDIEALATRHRAEGLRLLAYSLDEDPNDFAEMVHERRYAFDLVRLAPPAGPGLASAVGDLGGTFRGAIPYVAIVGRDGAMVRDFTGGAPAVTLDGYVTRALATAR